MLYHTFVLPSTPPGVVRETTVETLHRLGHDLARIARGELTALDAYRLVSCDTSGLPTWGFCLEAARMAGTDEVFVLIRTDETSAVKRTLHWVSLSSVYTRKHAHDILGVEYEGPAEEVLRAILHVFRDAFVFAVDTDWSYAKRLEFYYSFPFEELSTVRAVHLFRPVLFGSPTFAESIDVDKTPPKSE